MTGPWTAGLGMGWGCEEKGGAPSLLTPALASSFPPFPPPVSALQVPGKGPNLILHLAQGGSSI